MTDTTLSAHVLVFKDDRVLLVKHGDEAGHLTGVYGIPGGRVNEGEDVEDAAVRELLEETGTKVSKEDLQSFPNNQYTADIKRKDGLIRRYMMTVFLCEEFSGEIKVSDETIPEWIEISNLNSYNLLPNVERAIEAGLSFLNK